MDRSRQNSGCHAAGQNNNGQNSNSQNSNSQGNSVNVQRRNGPQGGNQRNRRTFDPNNSSQIRSPNYYIGAPIQLSHPNGGPHQGANRERMVRNSAPNFRPVRPPPLPSLRYPAQPGLGGTLPNDRYGNTMNNTSAGLNSAFGGNTNMYQLPNGQPQPMGSYPMGPDQQMTGQPLSMGSYPMGSNQQPNGQPQAMGSYPMGPDQQMTGQPLPMGSYPMGPDQQPNGQPQAMGSYPMGPDQQMTGQPLSMGSCPMGPDQQMNGHPLSMGSYPMTADTQPMGLQWSSGNGSVQFPFLPPIIVPPGWTPLGWGPPGIDPRTLVVPGMDPSGRVPPGIVQPGMVQHGMEPHATDPRGMFGNESPSICSYLPGGASAGNATSGSVFISNNFGGTVSVSNPNYYFPPPTQTPAYVTSEITSPSYPHSDGAASSANREYFNDSAPTQQGYAPTTSTTSSTPTLWRPSSNKSPLTYPYNKQSQDDHGELPSLSESLFEAQTTQPTEPELCDQNVQDYRKYFTQLQKQKKRPQDGRRSFSEADTSREELSSEADRNQEDFNHTTSAEKAADVFGKNHVRRGIQRTGQPYYQPPVMENLDGQTQVVFQRMNGSKQVYLTDHEKVPAVTERYDGAHHREMEAAIFDGTYTLPVLPDGSVLDFGDGIEQHQADEEEQQDQLNQEQLDEASDSDPRHLMPQLQQLSISSGDVRLEQSQQEQEQNQQRHQYQRQRHEQQRRQSQNSLRGAKNKKRSIVTRGPN